LEEKNEDNFTLQALFAEVNADWQDTNGRRFGVFDYAPHISVRVDDRPYTRDIATFVPRPVRMRYVMNLTRDA
jgi:hypothetical protein